MPEFVTTPIERTLDSRDFRREKRPEAPAESSEPDKTPSLPAPRVAEEEPHAIDIRA